MQINVHINSDDWVPFDALAVDGTAVNLDNATKVEVDIEREGETDRDIDDGTDPTLFKVGSSSAYGTDGFEVNFGQKFTDTDEAGQVWIGRVRIYDTTFTKGRRFGPEFKIKLVE